MYTRGEASGGGTAAQPRPAFTLTVVCRACGTLIGCFVFFFCKFWNRGIWRFHEDQVFWAIQGWGMEFLGFWLLPCHPYSPPSCPSEVEIGEAPDDWYMHNAIVTSCVLPQCAQTTPVSQQREVLFPSNFRSSVLLSQNGGGGGIWWTARTAHRGTGHLGRTETQRGRLWTACGQRCVDSKNSQTTPTTTSTSSIRQFLGAANTQTAHHATFSTAPTHQLLGSANAETTPARAPAAAADRKQRPDATCEGKNG